MNLRVALVILALATPMASAWSFHGDAEPDTHYDRDGGFMWATSDDQGLSRVYFDAVAEAATSGQNPNLAATHETVADPAPSFTAYLGVWRDCNQDGYLGAADGALLEYTPAEAAATGHPVNFSMCPIGSPWNNDGGNANPTLGIGAVSGLVTEFLWIGPQGWNAKPNDITYAISHMINDPAARVWGDYGPPGASPETTCAAWPLPRGTTASTGGALGYAACYDSTGTVAALPVPSVHAPVSLFGDPGSGSAGLLQRGSGRPTYAVWDCSKPQGTPVRDPGPRTLTVADPEPAQDYPGDNQGNYILAGSKGVEGIAQVAVFSDNLNGGPPQFQQPIADANGNFLVLPAPAQPKAPDTGGSLYDTAQGAELGAVEDCDPTHDVDPSLGLGPGPLLGKAPLPEDDVHGTNAAGGRKQSDIVFDFQQMHVSNQEGGALTDGNLGAPAIGDFFGHGLNTQDFGLSPLRDVNGNGPGWHSLSATSTGPRMVTRDQLALHAPAYTTFYAHIELSGVATPGSVGTYGAEACTSGIAHGAGVSNGWDCEPSDWWNAQAGASANPQNPFSLQPLGVTVGTTYQLRDVDCEDNAGLAGTCH